MQSNLLALIIIIIMPAAILIGVVYLALKIKEIENFSKKIDTPYPL